MSPTKRIGELPRALRALTACTSSCVRPCSHSMQDGAASARGSRRGEHAGRYRVKIVRPVVWGPAWPAREKVVVVVESRRGPPPPIRSRPAASREPGLCRVSTLERR